MSIIKKKEKYEYKLDPSIANEMLQNVFEAAGQEPNTIPFDKLVLRKEVKTGSLLTARTIAIVLLVISLLLPAIFLYEGSRISTPEIVNDYKEDNLLWIELNSTSVGIDYESSYAKSDSGVIIEPAKIDKKNRLIAFDTTESSLNIYIYNYAGKNTHAIYISK